MTLIEHFEELRTRLFIALGAWMVGAGVSFVVRARLLDWIEEPLPEGERVTVITTQLLEPLLVAMQVSAFAGILLASPVVLGQVWGFIAPGLYPEERRWAIPFVFLSAFAFISGTLFARYIVLPLMLPVLLGFLPGTTTLLSIGDYVAKMLLYMTVFGLLFTMPVIGFLTARLGMVRAPQLVQFRRWAIVGGAALAAIITPTADPLNFALVAVPLVVLYELTILVVRLSQRRLAHGREDPELTNQN